MTMPSKEYLEYISKRLEAMNPNQGGHPGNSCNEPFKMPSFMDQAGQTAMHYLKNKRETETAPDPLFPDRN